MNEININNVVIEITRRCNMTCEHCLRGNAQKRDIDDCFIDTFFSKVGKGYIGNITITGGEPSLAPEKIDAIISAAKKYGTSIGAFYIVTNGKVVPDAFLMAVMRLYCFCQEKDTCALQYSNDYYHDTLTAENRDRLEVFKFTSSRTDYKSGQGEYEISEGRAKTNGIGHHENKGITMEYSCIEDYIDFEYRQISEMEVYLNAKGYIICGCDWSYKSQDKATNKICHVNDFSLESVHEYLKQFEPVEEAA